MLIDDNTCGGNLSFRVPNIFSHSFVHKRVELGLLEKMSIKFLIVISALKGKGQVLGKHNWRELAELGYSGSPD